VDFSGLVRAIQDFWNFFWPAAVCLVILLGIVRTVAPCSTAGIRTWLTRLRPDDQAQVSAFKVIKRFGVDKLIPIAVAFCLLFFMDVAKTIVISAGEALPPTIVYRYDLWFLKHSSDEGFSCLWAHFSDKPTLDGLQRDVERELGELEAKSKDSKAFESVNYWTQKGGTAQEGFSACKFFIAWAILWAVIESLVTKKSAHPLSAAAICVGVLAITSALFLFRDVWSIEQAEYSRLSAVEVVLFQEKPSCQEITEEQQAAYIKVIEDTARIQMSENERWWRIQLFDSYYLRWLWREFFTNEKRPSFDYKTGLIQQEQWKGGNLQETRELASFYLAEASANRHFVHDGEQTQTNAERVKDTDAPEAARIVRSAITTAALPKYEGKRILWVDDHPENNAYEARMFKSLGIVVDQKTSTKDALDALSTNQYDVVITDMKRGPNDQAGYELLNEMRRRQMKVPLFIYSGSSNEKFRAEAMEKGAQGETNNPTELFQYVTGALLGSAEGASKFSASVRTSQD
jgi:CheY-like chemotaxis protein